MVDSLFDRQTRTRSAVDAPKLSAAYLLAAIDRILAETDGPIGPSRTSR